MITCCKWMIEFFSQHLIVLLNKQFNENNLNYIYEGIDLIKQHHLMIKHLSVLSELEKE